MASLEFSSSFDDVDDAVPVLQSDPFGDSSVSPELVSTDDNDDEIAVLQQQDEASSVEPAKPTPKAVPEGRPKRPLSGYNVFFKLQRELIISGQEDKEITVEDVENFKIDTSPPDKTKKRRHRKTHGKIGFRELARKIADKWKRLDAERRVVFEDRASIERSRYLRELDAWKKQNATKKTESDKGSTDSDVSPFNASIEYGVVENADHFGQSEQKPCDHSMNGMQELQNMSQSQCTYQHPQMPFAGDYYNVANRTYNLVQSAVPNAFGQQVSYPIRGSFRQPDFGQPNLSMDILNHFPAQSSSTFQGNSGLMGANPTQKQAAQQLSLQKFIMQQQTLHHLLQQQQLERQAPVQLSQPRWFAPLIPDDGGAHASGAVEHDHQGFASPMFEDQNPDQNEEGGGSMKSVFEAFL